MRPKRLLVIVLATVVVVIAALLAFFRFGPQTYIDLSQAELQEKLQARFPQEKCVLAVACLEIRSPKIQLTEGADRLGLMAEFVATLGHRKMPGTMSLSGKPRYVQSEGSFYLDDLQIAEFKMSGNAPDFDEVVRVRGPGLLKAIMQMTPVYTLKSDTRYGGLAKLALKSVTVVEGKLRITFIKPTI